MFWRPDLSKHKKRHKKFHDKSSQSLFSFALFTRVVVYGGLSLTIIAAVGQQFRVINLSSPAMSRSELFQRSLLHKIRVYEETDLFPAAEVIDSPGSHQLKVWTTSAPGEYGSGPQQIFSDQARLPHRREGVILTMDTLQQHYIGAVYVNDSDQISLIACQGDRPFKPTDISVTALKQGEPIDCPEGATRLDLD